MVLCRYLVLEYLDPQGEFLLDLPKDRVETIAEPSQKKLA